MPARKQQASCSLQAALRKRFSGCLPSQSGPGSSTAVAKKRKLLASKAASSPKKRRAPSERPDPELEDDGEAADAAGIVGPADETDVQHLARHSSAASSERCGRCKLLGFVTHCAHAWLMKTLNRPAAQGVLLSQVFAHAAEVERHWVFGPHLLGQATTHSLPWSAPSPP